MKRLFVLAGIIILAGFLPAVTAETPGKAGIVKSYAKLPLRFEANLGQTDSRVKFLARGSGYTLFLTPAEAVLTLRRQSSGALAPKAKRARRVRRAESENAVLRMRLLGANSTPDIAGVQKLRGKSNYLFGKDRTKWRTNVPHYAKVRYENVYPGIDLIFYGTEQRRLEYDFILAPGADASAIALGFEGAKRVEIDAEGDLVLHTDGGKVRQHKPVVYQEVAGVRKEIGGTYVLRDRNRVGFEVAAYDRSRPLIIDPVLSYSTYLGGGGEGGSYGIAVDATGHVYVAGYTRSAVIDFPTTIDSFQEVFQGGDTDAFVAKFDPGLSGEPSLVYATYLGGSGWDGGNGYGYGIDVDPGGNAYVTGWTESIDFPTVQALQPNLAGLSDVFVTKLNFEGSDLLFSTYLGGLGYDGGEGLALDGDGNAYVTGRTSSAKFPTTPLAFKPLCDNDAFIAKLNSSGSTLLYSTCLGGPGAPINDEESGYGIAVDGNGNAYVTGFTQSPDFPLENPFQAEKGTSAHAQTAFVTKLTADGSELVYSTYLGGSSGATGLGIAVEPDCAKVTSYSAYVVGGTSSSDFPTTRGAFKRRKPGGKSSVAFVTKLSPSGQSLVYSTFLGGSGSDWARAIAIDCDGNAHVTGETSSLSNFPTKNAFQPDPGGSADAFVTVLNAEGSALVSSSLLGGTGTDSGISIAVDGAGNQYVTGYTTSANFPTTENAFQDIFGGGIADAFVAKVSATSEPPPDPDGGGGGGPNCDKNPNHRTCQ